MAARRQPNLVLHHSGRSAISLEREIQRLGRDQTSLSATRAGRQEGARRVHCSVWRAEHTRGHQRLLCQSGTVDRAHLDECGDGPGGLGRADASGRIPLSGRRRLVGGSSPLGGSAPGAQSPDGRSLRARSGGPVRLDGRRPSQGLRQGASREAPQGMGKNRGSLFGAVGGETLQGKPGSTSGVAAGRSGVLLRPALS